MVLSRSSYYLKSLEAVFIEKKIPYRKFGGRKFMESAHIKDVFSALRIVNNYDDETNYKLIKYNIFFFYIRISLNQLMIVVT